MKFFSKKQYRPNAGFTIIEMIVSISIFIIVMLVVVGALISLSNASKKARVIRIATDNLSAAIDSMSRNIRMGSYYHCGCGGGGDPTFPAGVQSCPMTDVLGNGGGSCLAFESQNGDPLTANDQIVYRINSGRIQRSKDGGVSYQDLTAPEINITDLKFFVYGTTLDQDQPVIAMLLRGTATVGGKETTTFNVQTNISARTPNFTFTP